MSGARDEEVKVVKNVCKAASVYGRFVPPKTWLSLVCPRLLAADPRSVATDLMVLSTIIQSSDSELFQHIAEDLVLTLQGEKSAFGFGRAFPWNMFMRMTNVAFRCKC